MIDIEARDVDVPLSKLGERRAGALGRWLKWLGTNISAGKSVSPRK